MPIFATAARGSVERVLPLEQAGMRNRSVAAAAERMEYLFCAASGNLEDRAAAKAELSAVASTGGSCAVKVSDFVAYQARVGVGAVGSSRKCVQHG